MRGPWKIWVVQGDSVTKLRMSACKHDYLHFVPIDFNHVFLSQPQSVEAAHSCGRWQGWLSFLRSFLPLVKWCLFPTQARHHPIQSLSLSHSQPLAPVTIALWKTRVQDLFNLLTLYFIPQFCHRLALTHPRLGYLWKQPCHLTILLQ